MKTFAVDSSLRDVSKDLVEDSIKLYLTERKAEERDRMARYGRR